MGKDFLRLTKLFFNIYWIHSLAWVLLQISVFIALRRLTISESIDPPIPPTASNTIVFALCGIIALSFLTLILFLGNTFSCGQRTNWLMRLPFRTSSLNFFPLIAILSYGLAILLFIPWGAFDSGVSVFAVGIPVALFLSLKNSRNFLLGLFKSATIGIGLITMWMYLFYDWSIHQTQLNVEITALSLFTVIWLVLGKKERIYSFAASGAMLILLLASTIHFYSRVPKNFSEATLDHAFNPTDKTRKWIKKIALDSKYWERVEQFKLPSYVNHKSQDFIDKFSDEEKIEFIKNIEKNRETWSEVKLPTNRPLRVALYLQPEIKFSTLSQYPIGKSNITPVIEEYLYSNWKDSRVYCELLPSRKSTRYIGKLFSIEECVRELFSQAPWSFYSYVEYGEYEQQFDNHLLQAFEKSPSVIRTNLMMFLMNGWGLNRMDKKYEKYRNITFNQEPLTKNLLQQIKSDRHYEFLRGMKSLSKFSHKEFVKKVSHFSFFDRATDLPLIHLCQYLNNDCNTFLVSKKSKAVSLPQAWYYRFHDLTFQEVGVWELWINNQVVDPNSWIKIKELMEYAKSREDL